MNRYEGKVVLITGAGDVTQATSARLLQEGAKIALLDYSKKALEEAVQQLADEGYPTGNIMFVRWVNVRPLRTRLSRSGLV